MPTQFVLRTNRQSLIQSAKKSSITVAMLFFGLLLLPAAAVAQGTVLYSFTGIPDGTAPAAGLVRDSAGNLYGVTPNGGDESPESCDAAANSAYGCGIVFELSPASGGGWTETIIHTFTSGSDGAVPMGNLVMDSSGNLYGTTEYGGSGCSPSYYGCGTVYELSPAGGGTWTETILYNFTVATGVYPEAGLIMDSAGNLYGTTAFGANSACNTLGCGTVFELTKSGSTWTENILYVFQDSSDGGEPGSSLVFDAAGNLYGTAAIGGNTTTCNNTPYGCGTIYELSPGAGGWTETSLYMFHNTAKDGAFPRTGLTVDSLGNLYGVMSYGGASTYGYLYKLIPQAGGGYTFSPFYSFGGTHGGVPKAPPLVAGGILYGTVSQGGGENHLCSLGCGGVYRLIPHGDSPLYDFLGFGTANKGAAPEGTLTSDPSGNLYGTTSAGGASSLGTVFEIKP